MDTIGCLNILFYITFKIQWLMTTKKENRNKKKNDISKIFQILESENFLNIETVENIENEVLKAKKAKYIKIIDSKIEYVDKKINNIKIKIEKLKENKKKLNQKKRKENLKIFLWKEWNLAEIRKIIAILNNGISKKQNEIEKLEERKKEILIDKKELQEKISKININNYEKTERNITLKNYINNNPDFKIKKVLNRIDSENIRKNNSQKETIKRTILKNYENSRRKEKDNDIYKMAKELETYIAENFDKIVKRLESIQKNIRKKENQRQGIISKEKWKTIEEIYNLKEEEYNIQLEIMKLKKEYDEIKYNIEEKLKAYDWSTYEEKKTEILNNNKKNGIKHN